MAARGLAGSWGVPTENDPGRRVDRDAVRVSAAAKFHNEYSADRLDEIPDEVWQRETRGLLSRDDPALDDIMRVYEGYQQRQQ